MLRPIVLRAVLLGVLAGGLSACTADEEAAPRLVAPSATESSASASESASAAPAPSPPQRPPRDELAGAYDEYVALGDSFTAGPLIAPEDPRGQSCARSLVNYPHLLADWLEVKRLRDMSCSGAGTHDMTSRQQNLFGTNAPQLGALRAGTDLVTIGIGGNDFGVFGRLIVGCARVRSEDPGGSPCQDRVGAETATQLFDETGDRVVAVLREIRRRSPQADVLLVGYPRLTPTSGTCPDVLPYATGDYAFAVDVEEALNAALTSAADAADVRFVDVAAASEGHDACAGDKAWVNGRRTVPGQALSYHPFGRGMRAVADLVYAELG